MDAYTLRKIAPRILIGAIGINLSIYLCLLAIDITNVVGDGLFDLITAPFDTNRFNSYGAGGSTAGGILSVVAIVGLSVGTLTVVGLSAVFMLILGIILWVLVIIGVLVFRQGLLVLLTILSPIAIALWMLPNTEKYFRQWWEWFIKALLVYPIIAALFAISNALTTLYINQAANEGGNDAIRLAMAAIIAAAPLFLIPLCFRFAGGILASVGQMASAPASRFGGFSRRFARQRSQKIWSDPDSLRGRKRTQFRTYREGKGLSGSAVGAGVTRGLSSMARGRGFMSGYKGGAGALAGRQAFDSASEFMEKNADFGTFKGNDDALWAFRHGRSEADVRRILQQRGVTDPAQLESTTAMVLRARSAAGDRVAGIAGARAQAKTGTGYADNAQMLEDIVDASGGNMDTGGRMLAEMRQSALQGGQVQLGIGGFQDQFNAMTNLARGVDGNGNAYTADDANRNVMDSVIESAGGGHAVHGKPGSARAIAGGHADRIKRLINSANTGETMKIDGVERQATGRDIKQALASAHGVHDALRGASPQNAKAFADTLMGTTLDVDNMSPDVKSALGPAWESQSGGFVSSGPEGGISVREAMRGLAGKDQAYDEMRHDFATQAEEYGTRTQPQQPQQPGEGPQAPGGPPATPSGI